MSLVKFKSADGLAVFGGERLIFSLFWVVDYMVVWLICYFGLIIFLMKSDASAGLFVVLDAALSDVS